MPLVGTKDALELKHRFGADRAETTVGFTPKGD